MKIGVVTFFESKSNYGNVLQYLATQTFLEKRGHEVTLLGNTKKKSIKDILKKWVVGTPLYSFYLYFALRNVSEEDKRRDEKFRHQSRIEDKQERLHPRHFDEFRNRYFHILKTDLKSDPQVCDYDCYVSGSDQIWSIYSWNGFLDFGKRNALRISIAPSCGNHCISDDQIANVSKQLQKYKFITVREEDGLELCQRAGRSDAHLILDPTFLMTACDYEKYEKYVTDTESPYILLYLLGASIAVDIADVYSFAKANGLKVKYIASQGRDDDYDKIYPTVGEWLYLVSHAETVITNSFHGTAFAIIYRRKFLVLPIIGTLKSMQFRFNSLLGRLYLENRIYDKDLNTSLNDIDYRKAETYINNNRDFVTKLLSDNSL